MKIIVDNNLPASLAQLRGPIAQRLKEALPKMTPGSRMMVTDQAVVFYSG